MEEGWRWEAQSRLEKKSDKGDEDVERDRKDDEDNKPGRGRGGDGRERATENDGNNGCEDSGGEAGHKLRQCVLEWLDES